MNKKLVAMGLMVSATVFISGCTTWNGISQADKPGSYYIPTSFHFMGVHTGMLLCTSNETGNLKCKKVDVDN
jgi:hypothetical protein